eukprot:gene5903-6588_t
MENVSKIQLVVNGKEYKILNPRVDIRLSEWLRDDLHLTGTKLLCKEGGCGSCIVAVSKLNQFPERVKAVNSCLMPLISLNGYHVRTVEGLGGSKNGFHVIQERFAQNFASQCGFCTPGFVMNGFSLLAGDSNGKTAREIEDNLDGNICRCTGYRPILDALKSFGKDEKPVDIEDILKCCTKKSCSKVSPVLIDQQGNDLASSPPWFKPECVKDLNTVMKKFEFQKLKFVAGNTGAAILKDKSPYDAFIELNNKNEHGIKIGSAVTLTRIIEFMKEDETLKAFSPMTDYLVKIGSLSVRNVATWAGNLMIFHRNRGFSSDVFLAFETIESTLEIADVNSCIKTCTIKEFLETDMANKAILSVTLPFIKDDAYLQFYKIMPRKQNSYGYVSAGFYTGIEHLEDTITFTNSPTSIVFGGIGLEMSHAIELESYLRERPVRTAFEEAIKILQINLKSNAGNKLADFDYCKNASANLFYKFCMQLLGKAACQRSLKSSQPFESEVSSGQQFFDTSEASAPLNQPLQRIEGKLQASGQNIYVGDLPKYQTEVYAALVLAKKASANLKRIDYEQASRHPGFLACLTEKDVPGENNWLGKSKHFEHEIFASKKIECYGQSLAMVIADTQLHANEIADLIDVEYVDVQTPVTSLADAIEKKLFFPKRFPDLIVGNTEEAFKSCDHVIESETYYGSQYHFHMEPHTCLVVPQSNGFSVFSATQSAMFVQEAVANALGINASSVDVQIPRIGGGFGGKISYPSQFAAALAIASNALDRPVRMTTTLSQGLMNVGKRAPIIFKYKVGFSKEGRLLACDVKIYCDVGWCNLTADGLLAALYMDNAYFCPNWNVEVIECKTNTPCNTFVRAPGTMAAAFAIEAIVDHVASFLGNKTPEEIQELNLYETGQVTINDRPFTDCFIRNVWKNLRMKSNFDDRKIQVAEFNKKNRWKKRGISLMPLKYDIGYLGFNFTALVSIYYADGTVAVSHGGVEMGQGINTKVCQVAAKWLNIPMELISIKPMTTITSPNSLETGASIASELNCLAVHKCCEILLARIAPIKEEFPDLTWKELIKKCAEAKVDLSAQYMYFNKERNPYSYSVFGAVCSEAEIDVLTGENRILRSDIMYDSGESMNPSLDVGQIEGSFVMGIGHWLTEVIKYDQDTGRPLTASTWSYKPPMPKDIPIDMRVYLLNEAVNPVGFVRSKAVGEPGINMSAVCVFAIKRAIEAARDELGVPAEYFPLDGAITVDKIQTLCKVEPCHLYPSFGTCP